MLLPKNIVSQNQQEPRAIKKVLDLFRDKISRLLSLGDKVVTRFGPVIPATVLVSSLALTAYTWQEKKDEIYENRKDLLNHQLLEIIYPIEQKFILNKTRVSQEKSHEDIRQEIETIFHERESILRSSPDHFLGLYLQVYKGVQEDENSLFYDSREKKEPLSKKEREELQVTETVSIWNQKWTFILHSNGVFEKRMDQKVQLNEILISGTVMSFLLTLLVLFLIKKRNESFVAMKQLEESENRYRVLFTEQERMTQEIFDMAIHDTLTGLPNRRLFLETLNRVFAEADREKSSVAILFLDLDNFKIVNDSIWHDIGDALLQQVADRMKQCIRKEDMVARYGGDEFLIFLSGLGSPQDASLVAQKFIDVLSDPFKIKGHEIHIGASIGISIYPQDARDIDNLMKYGDIAMYYVKASGRNGYQFFSKEMQEASKEHQLLATALHHALERHEMSVVFQLVVDTETEEIVGMESLLRWKNKELWSISSANFIPIAESTALIIPISNWLIWEVCKSIKKWEEQGIVVPRIAINLSARQFRAKTLLTDIISILEENNVSPSQICLEITESMLIDDVPGAIHTLHSFSEAGFELSIDDFGTGYSNFSYLQKFWVQKLKIDRSFITDIGRENGSVVVNGMISLAHSLGMKVVAEGVETREQLEILRAIGGCDQIQGFYFWYPDNFKKITERLLEEK